VQVLIEHRQSDVGQERGEDATLRRSGVGVLPVAALGEDAGLQERLDQSQHTPVSDPSAHPVRQGRVVDRVETRFDISVEHPAVPWVPNWWISAIASWARRIGRNP